MKKLTAALLITSALAASIYGKFNIGIGIVTALIGVSLYSLFKGYSLDEVIDSAYSSGKKAFLVIKIFFLVGIISSMWINSGTIPGVVYYGIKFINPSYFYVLAFILTSAVSFMLGSSFGTVGTVGIALMAVGRGIGVDPSIAGGAIISAAYFGDRCSPVSSSANLVATLTETNLYNNIKNMMKTGILPFILACILYVLSAEKKELLIGENPLSLQIQENFVLNPVIFIPVAVILISAVLKIKVKLAMGMSILTSIIIAKIVQGYSFYELFTSFFIGFTFKEDIPLKAIIKGGGLFSMWKACLIVFISCCFSGLIQRLGILEKFESFLLKAKNRAQLFFFTTIVSGITSALGCNQSIAVVMGIDIMKGIYEKKNIKKEELAIDIENTGILIPALIPWNIAGLIPATMMGLEGIGHIPYSFYLYLVPIITLISYKLKNRSAEISWKGKN